jgi:hypothetical protein
MNGDEQRQWDAISQIGRDVSELMAMSRETLAHIRHLSEANEERRKEISEACNRAAEVERRVRSIENKQYWFSGAAAIIGGVAVKISSFLFR